MKSIAKRIGLSTLLVLLGGLTEYSEGSKPNPYAIRVSLKPVTHPRSAGPIQLGLRITPEEPCDGEVTIRVKSIYNLEYIGEREWVAEFKGLEPLFYTLDVTIPPNDTSGIKVDAGGVCGPGRASCYFVTTGDTVEVFGGNPRYRVPRPTPKGPRKRIPSWTKDTLRSKGTHQQGFLDSTGKLISKEEFERLKLSTTRKSKFVPGDTTVIWMKDENGDIYPVDRETHMEQRRQEKLAKRMEKMRKLEETPLTDHTSQAFVVGDKVYQRKRDEYKFTEKEPVTDRSAYYKKRRDSARANAPIKVYEFTLDLRKPDHFTFAAELIDSLIPTDSAGFYRGFITIDVRDSLREKGIIIYKSRNIPRRDRNEMTDPITH